MQEFKNSRTNVFWIVQNRYSLCFNVQISSHNGVITKINISYLGHPDPYNPTLKYMAIKVNIYVTNLFN